MTLDGPVVGFLRPRLGKQGRSGRREGGAGRGGARLHAEARAVRGLLEGLELPRVEPLAHHGHHVVAPLGVAGGEDGGMDAAGGRAGRPAAQRGGMRGLGLGWSRVRYGARGCAPEGPEALVVGVDPARHRLDGRAALRRAREVDATLRAGGAARGWSAAAPGAGAGAGGRWRRRALPPRACLVRSRPLLTRLPQSFRASSNRP